MKTTAIEIPKERIAEYSKKWKLKELSIFGSALGDDFGPESDVDILVEFLDDADWDLYDWIDMIDELSAIFGRHVDLVAKEGLRNPYRRRSILGSREIVYEA